MSFTKSFHAIERRKDMTQGSRRVLCRIIAYNKIRPTEQQIADDLGISRSTVIRAITQLVTLGYLWADRNRGKKRRNQYTVLTQNGTAVEDKNGTAPSVNHEKVLFQNGTATEIERYLIDTSAIENADAHTRVDQASSVAQSKADEIRQASKVTASTGGVTGPAAWTESERLLLSNGVDFRQVGKLANLLPDAELHAIVMRAKNKPRQNLGGYIAAAIRAESAVDKVVQFFRPSRPVVTPPEPELPEAERNARDMIRYGLTAEDLLEELPF